MPRSRRLRSRQIKNFLVTLLMSVGTPMLQMGDEMRRTQRGNNNAYCQDNDVSWLDWSLLDRHRDLHRFVRTLMGYRRQMMSAGSAESLELSLNELLRHAEFDWHGVRLGQPDWTDDSHSIACTIRSTPLQLPLWLHVMINAYWEALDFELPSIPPASLTGWRRWIDTARKSPEDIMDAPEAPLVRETQYRVAPRSVAVLFARMPTLPVRMNAVGKHKYVWQGASAAGSHWRFRRTGQLYDWRSYSSLVRGYPGSRMVPRRSATSSQKDLRRYCRRARLPRAHSGMGPIDGRFSLRPPFGGLLHHSHHLQGEALTRLPKPAGGGFERFCWLAWAAIGGITRECPRPLI